MGDPIKKPIIDVHCHALPGLDDGAKTVDESLQLLKSLWEAGYTHIVTTPHFYPGHFTPSRDSIEVTLEAMRKATANANIDVTLIQGRECFLDYELTNSPDRDSFPFCWGDRRYQLIELPQVTHPQFMSSYVSDLSNQGIVPILAHVERYQRILNDPQRLEEYTSLGFKIQVDIMSASDESPKTVRKVVLKLLENRQVDFLASDIHRASQLPRFQSSVQFLQKEFGSDVLAQFGTLD